MLIVLLYPSLNYQQIQNDVALKLVSTGRKYKWLTCLVTIWHSLSGCISHGILSHRLYCLDDRLLVIAVISNFHLVLYNKGLNISYTFILLYHTSHKM